MVRMFGRRRWLHRGASFSFQGSVGRTTWNGVIGKGEPTMSQLLKDGKYRTSPKDSDLVLEMYLRRWTARPRLLDPAINPLFERMHEFARQVHSAGFGPALKNLAGDIACGSGPPELTELIGERLCQGINASGNVIERKSLEETLYFCTGLVPDLPPLEFGKRLESFLALRGSKGLIRVFLSAYVSNLIYTNLHDSLKASDPKVLHGRMEAIERICHKAAATAVRSLNTWSEPDPSAVATLISDLRAGMTRTFGSRRSLHRGV